jgi:SAM-dependent methyltransferase
MITGSKNFYDEISGFYGKMIDFEKNLELRISAYKNIFPVPGKVVDIGCGIGLDSIALAKNGHLVSAFDPSPKMIEEAKKNAGQYNQKIEARVNSFESIQSQYTGKFNYVVSVGNTIAHLSSAELLKAFKKINRLMAPGGKTFLHILNYDLILRESRRINNISIREGHAIIRFYDLRRNKISFNILSFSIDRPREFNLVTTIHYPHSKKSINNFMKHAGFIKIKFSRNFNGDRFDQKSSKDIFIEAIKK